MCFFQPDNFWYIDMSWHMYVMHVDVFFSQFLFLRAINFLNPTVQCLLLILSCTIERDSQLWSLFMLSVFILCSWRRSWIKKRLLLQIDFNPLWSIVHNILKFAIISRCLILLLITYITTCKKNSQKLSFAPLLSLLTFSSCLIFLFFWNNHLILVYTHITFITWDTTTDKETDESWDIFILWKINSGLVWAAGPVLWKKVWGRLWATFEARFFLCFHLIFFLKKSCIE